MDIKEILRKNLYNLHQRINAAKKQYAVDKNIELMAVSKNSTWNLIEILNDLGLRKFAENKVQEAATKFKDPSRELELSLIGHLQKNKISKALAIFDSIMAIDSLPLLEKLEKRAVSLNKNIKIGIEINPLADPDKFGLTAYKDLLDIVELCLLSPRLELVSLMVMAPFPSAEYSSRRTFASSYEWQQKIRSDFNLGSKGLELSMGMSSDLEWAIAEGTDSLRIGRALFDLGNSNEY